MKKAIIILSVVFTAFGLQAQKVNFSASVSINSSLTKQLGNYPDRTGNSFGGSLLGSILLGAISGGDYWGTYDANEDWVTGRNVNGRSQFNFTCEFPVDTKKRMYLGATYTNANFTYTKNWYSGRATTTHEKFSGITFDARYSWFRNNWLNLSSGVSAGIAKQTVTGFVSETRHPLLGQITPLKATVSHENVGVFFAPGLGARGTQVGLDVRF
jgi:hypothetical protein